MTETKYLNARSRRLCMVLRRLRNERGMSAAEVGGQLGVAASTITRVECGERGINRDDLAALLAIYRTARPLRDAMLKLHTKQDEPGLLDRGELKMHPDLEKWIDFEEDTTRIRNYQPLLIPGLLQTFHYARAVIEGFGIPLPAQEVEDRVSARIARQALLRKTDRPKLDVILHEAALHQRIGGAEVMRDQLGYLLEAARRNFNTIRIIPTKVGAHAGMEGPFVIMDYRGLPSLVHLENKVASLYLEEKADVEAYRLAFDGLLSVALSPEDSAAVIGRIAAGMA